MIDHQRLSTSVNATQRSPMIGNMAQQSHSQYVAQDNLCDVSLIERSPRRLDTLSGAACAARTMEPYRKVETEFGEKCFITAESVDRHVAQIHDALVAAGHAQAHRGAPEPLEIQDQSTCGAS
jgi:hypothetical protein